METKKIYGRIFFLIGLSFLIALQLACNTKSIKNGKFPELEDIPDWLKLNVEEVFTEEGVTVWLPTDNFQTSSLVKVPRFPHKISENEIAENPALKNFKIIPLDEKRVLELVAVRNEQISAQIALGAKKNLTDIKVAVGDFVALDGTVLKKENIQTRFVAYVPVQRARTEYTWASRMENIIGEEVSGTMTPNLVADPIFEMSSIDVLAYRAQAVWFTFKVPWGIHPGEYSGNIMISSKQFKDKKYNIKLDIKEQRLPNPLDYKFHLDLWVNPSAVAAYYQLEHWSEEHWQMIKKYLKDYASRGGKDITAIIIREPWHKPWLNQSTRSQSVFPYQSMVKWIKNREGDWEFDFSIFDKYVSMAMDLGINKRINAFSLTPFHTGQIIYYWDEEDHTDKKMEINVEDELYEKIWTSFLTHFRKHVLTRGWLEKTYLAFDEKPEPVLKRLEKIIQTAAPEFLNRITIAGHPEATSMAQNLSLSYTFFPEQKNEKRAVIPVKELIRDRNKANQLTTFYLCAEPDHPNTLSYSPAIESQLIPWLALKYKLNGYLRWAYNNWTKNPFQEPVFLHNQGDDYYVYPGKDGPVTSVRWELLKEGIEDYELFRLVEQDPIRVTQKDLKNAIELATRNQDGRYKEVEDMLKARNILLKNEK